MAKTKTKSKRKTMAKLQPRATKTSSAKKSAPVSRAKPKAKPKAKARPKQTFNVSHLRAEDFRADGLRTYAQYRDLGMSKATNGLLQAHVIRMVPPCDPKVVSKRHYHDVDVQMIYVLKGWMKGEYDGQVVTMREGTAWLQPPKIKHTVLRLFRRLRAAGDHPAGGIRHRGARIGRDGDRTVRGHETKRNQGGHRDDEDRNIGSRPSPAAACSKRRWQARR